MEKILGFFKRNSNFYYSLAIVIPESAWHYIIGYSALIIVTFFILRKIITFDFASYYFRVLHPSITTKFINEHNRLWRPAKGYLFVILCCYSLLYTAFAITGTPWFFMVLFFFCFSLFLFGLNALVLKYNAFRGTTKKSFYSRLAAYLLTLAGYFHKCIFGYLIQTRYINDDGEEHWIVIFAIKNAVTWTVIIKLSFFMFLYMRLTSLILGLLFLAHRTTEWKFTELVKKAGVTFTNFLKYLVTTTCNFFIFCKYVCDLKEFEQPKRMLVWQWYEALQKHHSKYKETLSSYRGQLRKEGRYGLGLVDIIANSPTSQEKEFTKPFRVMSITLAILTFVRFLPFIILANIIIIFFS